MMFTLFWNQSTLNLEFIYNTSVNLYFNQGFISYSLMFCFQSLLESRMDVYGESSLCGWAQKDMAVSTSLSEGNHPLEAAASAEDAINVSVKTLCLTLLKIFTSL